MSDPKGAERPETETLSKEELAAAMQFVCDWLWKPAPDERATRGQPWVEHLADAVTMCARYAHALRERVREAERELGDTMGLLGKYLYPDADCSIGEVIELAKSVVQRAELAESRLASLTEAAKRLTEAWRIIMEYHEDPGIYSDAQGKGDAAAAAIERMDEEPPA